MGHFKHKRFGDFHKAPDLAESRACFFYGKNGDALIFAGSNTSKTKRKRMAINSNGSSFP